MPMTNLKPIRSFVIRAGRTTERQRHGLEQGGKFCLDPSELLDVKRVFGQDGFTVLEIGFGMGKSLSQQALQYPNWCFIGVEVHPPGVGALLADLLEGDLNNVRIYQADAIDVLTQCVSDNSLDLVQVFFPDPWPKKRHHKRRLIQPAFIDLVVSKLKPGGQIHLATDWQHYAEHMLAVLQQNNALENTVNTNFLSNTDRPLTKFERRGKGLGHEIFDLVFKKR